MSDKQMQIDDASSFVPIDTTEEPVHSLTRDRARRACRVYRGQDDFEVTLPEVVLERCLLFGKRAAPDEWFGLVVGKLCEEDGLRHLLILGVVPDPEARATTGMVETSVGSEFRTRMSARVLFPDGIIVGWAHGHVRCGAYFSSTDKRTQRSWTQPHSVSLVVDPWADEPIALYRGPDSELLVRVIEDSESAAQNEQAEAEVPRRWDRFRVATRRAASWSREKLRRRWKHLLVAAAVAFVSYLALTLWEVAERVAALEARPRAPAVEIHVAPQSAPPASVVSEPSASEEPENICVAEELEQ